MRRGSVMLGVVVLLASLLGDGHGASAASATVMLGDGPIPLSRAASLHCHDLERPIIRCFRTERQLMAAVRASMTRPPYRRSGAILSSISYVHIFADAGFDGASMFLTGAYSNLGDIGWNDRISSFRSVNNGAGTFSQHAGYEGTHYAFCCDTAVSNVGVYNDTWSSVTGSA